MAINEESLPTEHVKDNVTRLTYKIQHKIDSDDIQYKRKRLLLEKCRTDISRGYHEEYAVEGKAFFYSENTNFGVCKVPKTGCTFWGKVIMTLDSPINVRAAFRMSRHEIHMRPMGRNAKFFKEFEGPGRRPMAAIVGRNPYTRLFSAFIDKVFLLGGINRNFGRALRTGLHRIGIGTCGYAVSFNAFLKHVVALAHLNIFDEHWAPIAMTCDPCNINYDFITKQETLTDDVIYTISKLNMSTFRREDIKNILQSSEFHNKDLYSLVVSMMHDYDNHRLDCHSLVIFLQKFWTSLQIQGKIHRSLNFQMMRFKGVTNPADIANVIEQELRRMPLSDKEKAQQRHAALVDAYKKVDTLTLVNIRKVYRLDFLLFGYDTKLPS